MAKRRFTNMREANLGTESVSHRQIQAPKAPQLYLVPIEQVRENPYQTRIEYRGAHVVRLAQSLLDQRAQLPQTRGLQQPPTGRIGMVEAGSGAWRPLPAEILQRPEQVQAAIGAGAVVQLAFGNNRWQAFRLLALGPEALGLDAPGFKRDASYGFFPVGLAVLTDREMSDQAATENAKRMDISPIEAALSLQQRIDDFGLTQEEAGRPFGLSRVQVANKLALLELPAIVQRRIQQGELSETHGRLLKQLNAAPAVQAEVVARVVEAASMSTREVQELVQARIAELPLLENLLWPEDWQPGAFVQDENLRRVVGGCADCGWRVRLGREKFERCSQRACFAAKSLLWTVEQPLIAAARLRARVDVPEERLCVPGSGDYLEAGSRCAYFGSEAAPRQMVEEGHCSFAACACLAVHFVRYRNDYLAVAPEVPELVYGCCDGERLAARVRAVRGEESSVAASRVGQPMAEQDDLARAAAENAEAKREMVEAFVQEVGLEALFAAPGFLAYVADRLLGQPMAEAAADELQRAIVQNVLGVTAQEWIDLRASKALGSGYFGFNLDTLYNVLAEIKQKL